MKSSTSFNSSYAFIYEMTGKTTASVLNSSLKRMVSTYGNKIPWLGHKVRTYNRFAKGFDNLIWDALITRGCVNVLMSCGMTEKAAIASIRTYLYIGVGSSAQGRHVGVKGERKGEGRKKQGSNKTFIVKDSKTEKVYLREWNQITFTNRSGAMLDFVIEFYSNYRKANIKWSRQKLITLMSRMKPRYEKIPSFKDLFGI